MQSVEPILSKRFSPPEIRCGPLPLFDLTDVESVRRAFRSAAACPLRQAWRDDEEIGFSPAVVRAGWRENSLLIFAELTDADIFTNATQLNQRIWELGDAFEIFLKAEGRENYLEMQIAPNNQRLQLHFPDGDAVKIARKDGLEKFMIQNESFQSRAWIAEGTWQVYAEIPSATVCNSNDALTGARWRFSFGRYDYTRGADQPVISSTSPHAKCDFHRQHEWGVMIFKNYLQPN